MKGKRVGKNVAKKFRMAVKPVTIEVATMLLSPEEHKSLHADRIGFVNANKVFCNPVISVDLPDHPPSPTSPTYTVVMSHWPDSNAKGTCLY